MGYLQGKPNGILYIGNVKWSNDYKHTMLFKNQQARNTFFLSNFTKIKNNVIFYNQNGYIDIKGNIEFIEQYNYCFFVNDSDISNTPYCCFINDYEYIAPQTTRLHIELDVFQMYVYSITFFKCEILRGHVSDDSIGKWNAPEPIGYEKDVFNLISEGSTDWSITWALETTAIPKNTLNLGFEYGGFSPGTNNATGSYFYALGDGKNETPALHDILQDFLQGELINRSHIDDVVGLTAIPLWAWRIALDNGIISGDYTDTYLLYKSNPLLTRMENINYNPKQLASGYVPKNNKLFTSLAKELLIHNKNGLNIPLLPELFNDDVQNGITQPFLVFRMKPLNSNSIKGSILNYQNNKSEFEIPYNATLQTGMNVNTGVQGALNRLKGVLNIAGNVGLASVAPTPLTIGGATASVFTEVSNAFGGQGKQFGNCSDITSISPEFITPQVWDISPTFDKCKIIDDYLTLYGYAINQIDNVNKWLNTRKIFNYIQTNNINLSVQAPTNYENKLKDIFNNGVTLWHSYNDFGNYEADNTII